MSKRRTTRAARDIASLLFLLATACIAHADGEVVVFVQGDEADDARVRAIADVAGELDAEFRTVDVSSGAPDEVHLTPLVAYQDHRGRSIYQGRLTTLDRVRSFIRTSRAIRRDAEPFHIDDVPIRLDGRTTIATPIKVTALSGTIDPDFDANAFHANAVRAIVEAMPNFARAVGADLDASDRRFYIDFHPYRDADLLFVSFELYSQFNCHEPVFSALDDPVMGLWDGRDAVFGEAAAELVTQIERVIGGSSGDAFTPIPLGTPSKTWDELGLALPEAPAGAGAGDAVDIELPTRWAVTDTGPPPVVFTFPPPLDMYVGEGRRMSGELDLSGATPTGRFVIPVRSVTMGDPLLDDEIRGPGVLFADEHPDSSFVVTSIDWPEGEIDWGTPRACIMSGRFTMRGVEVPLSVLTSFEPMIDEDGAPRLRMQCQWSLRLKDAFGITGPDGPDPQRDTVEFSLSADLVAGE